MSDYCVRLIDLPPSVHGMVSMDESGFYNIYLNAHDNSIEQRRTLDHELRHIALEHFFGDRNMADIEKEAEGLL